MSNNASKGIPLFTLWVALSIGAALPSSANATQGTLTVTKNTTLTEDHNGNVVVAADNVTLDCAGHTIGPPAEVGEDGPGSGVLVQNRSGVTVKSCRVTGFLHGIEVSESVNVCLTGNHAFDNVSGEPGTGLLVGASTATTLRANLSTGNVQGVEIVDSQATLLEYNRVEGSLWAGIIVNSSSGTLGRGNVVLDNGGGIELYASSLSVFVANRVSRTRDAAAIQLSEGSSGNTIIANRVTRNHAGGIHLLSESSQNKVLRNFLCDNGALDVFDDGSGTSNLWKDNRFCEVP